MDLQQRLRETGALLQGHFRLSSGLHSADYVQCARLLEHPRDARALGSELAARIRPWKPELIVAPALGGLIIGFAVADALDLPMIFTERKEGTMAMRRGFEINLRRRVVIVEDVVTTGKSSLETAAAVGIAGATVVGYAALLNRSGSDRPFGPEAPFVALKSMAFETFAERECPLCKQGIPLDTPGSRFVATR